MYVWMKNDYLPSQTVRWVHIHHPFLAEASLIIACDEGKLPPLSSLSPLPQQLNPTLIVTQNDPVSLN